VSPLDHVELVGRRAVGPKESVCVVKVGSERFLVGVTSSQVSLLGRLDGVRATTRDGEEPAPSDFARELSGVAVPRHASAGPVLTEASVQALLDRSRERLERLARLGTEAARTGGARG
jgi:flagellar biogenesis protein FliO